MKKLLAMLAMTACATVFAEKATVNGIEWTYTLQPGDTVMLGDGAGAAIKADKAVGAVKIPSSLGGYKVTAIAEGAFMDCKNMTSVTVPEGVTDIEQSAFLDCSKLTSVKLPDSLRYISRLSFNGCPDTLYDVKTAPGLKLVDGWVLCKDSGLSGAVNLTGRRGLASRAIENCDSITSVTIPGNITEIVDNFYECESLQIATIASGVKTIENSFRFCDNLQTVTIPSSVTFIISSFVSCDHLSNVAIPSTATYVDDSFRECDDSLYDTTTIPGAQIVDGWVVEVDQDFSGTLDLTGAKGIGSLAIRDCANLTALHLPKDFQYICGRIVNSKLAEYSVDSQNQVYTSYNKALYSKDRKTLLRVPNAATEIVFPSEVTTIGTKAAYDNRNIKHLTIPSSVKTIEERAFEDCSNIEDLTLSEGLVTIGHNAFNYCRNVENIRVPSTVKEIGYAAFGMCYDLEKLLLPDTLEGEISELYIVGGKDGKGKDLKIEYYSTGDRTVTFDANGGTPAKTTIKRAKNAKIGSFPKVTLKGYTLKGWYTKKSGGTEVKETTKVTKDVTYYAQWKTNKYKIKFNANGGKGSAPKTMTVAYGKAVKLSANKFKRTDYTFLGWSKSKKATKATYKDKAKVKNLSHKNGATVTLYAVWSRNVYKVNFMSHGGSGTMKTLSVKSGEKTKLTANAFKKTGYTFKNWSTKANGKGDVYKDNGYIQLTKSGGAKVKLYAQWTPNKYKIKFNKNGGKGTAPKTINAVYDEEVKMPSNKLKRTKYTFLGWSKSKKATTATYERKEKVKNVATGGTVTLYAVWIPNKYTICLEPNGAAGTTKKQVAKLNAKVKLDNAFEREGYILKGWATSPNGKVVYAPGASVINLAKVGKSKTLYAVWSLPDWACGSFLGCCGYVDDTNNHWYDGKVSGTISTLGKLNATLTFVGKSGGVTTATVSASDFTYNAKQPLDKLILDLLDYDDDLDPVDLKPAINAGLYNPTSTTHPAYIYKDVTVNLPDGTSRKVNIVVFQWYYDGKGSRGVCAVKYSDTFMCGLEQDLYASKTLTLPKFDGTPVVDMPVEIFDDAGLSGITKGTATFKADGTVVVEAYSGTVKQFSATCKSRMWLGATGEYGLVFCGSVDEVTANGTYIGFDFQLRAGSDGKVSASEIFFGEEDD